MSVPAALARRAAEKPPAPNEDKLTRLRERLAVARDLELRIIDVDLHLAALQTELNALRREELPAMFQELGISSLGLDASGNVPAYDTKLVPFYSASIPKDTDRAEAALAHIEKVWKTPDLIKTIFTVDYGRGERKAAAELTKFLKAQGTVPAVKTSVHASTLTAEVRRRFEAGVPLSTAELEKVGAVVGRVVKMAPKK